MNRGVTRRIRLVLACVPLVLSGGAATGVAQTPTLDKCLFNSVPNVAFGTYDGTTKDVTVQIKFICGSAAKEIYIMLDTGPDRFMLGPRPSVSFNVGYELYRRDAQGALSVWTNNVSQTTAYYNRDPKDQTVIAVDLVGRVLAGYSAPGGSYFDDLVVRMDWDPNGAVGIQEITAPVQVTINGSGASCSVATTNLAFGTYDPLIVNSSGAGSDLDSQATITVSCSSGAAPLVWISPGTAGRIMTGPGNLSYELYSDATRNTVWGSTSGTAIALPVSSGVAQQVTVYGRIPRGQNVAVGAYSQNVTVTVNF